MLQRFDATIFDLGRYEDIRYPNKVVEQGMVVRINFESTIPSNLGQNSPPPDRQYDLIINEIDSFVKVTFEKANFTLPYYLIGLKEGAIDYLIRGNKVEVWSGTS
jgi:hypothetical protein